MLRLEARDAAAVLAELELLGVPGQRRPGRIDLVVVARLLVVVHRSSAACARSRRRDPRDARRRELAGELVLAVVKAIPERRAGGVRAADADTGSVRSSSERFTRRRDDADARLAAAEVLLRAEHRVVRHRLDGLIVDARSRAA